MYAGRMTRERLRDLAFIAVIAILVAWVGLALAGKVGDCSGRGGTLEIFGRATWVQCRLPDGSRIPM
jgi:hypothetical protein